MQSVLRWIFWKIDGIIALFIRFLYGLIFDIASARILENYIYEFMGRVYTLLAIFMLFKLSISVVNYILNPDQLTDKSKGFSKLIQNVIIVMALVIMTPQLFDWAYKLQCLILNSGVINTIITNEPNSMSSKEVSAACFGGEDQCYSIKQSKKANSYLLTYSLYSTFVYAKDGDDDSIADISDSSANTRYKSFKTCAEAVQTDSTYVEANNCIFNWKTVKRSDNEYLLLASTACLVFTAYVLLVFAIDIAIRSVKLCFLQLIAPVPIISMLDPNSGKSGMFSKWLKECSKTYGLLFLRLAIVYFVSEIISQVLKDGITTASGCSISMLAKIFIVLGALAFAKQLPDFIKSITGIEMGGGLFSLKKRLDSVPGLNRATAGALGYVGGGAANVIAGIKSGKKPWEIAGSALAGATSGAFRGLTSKEKSPFKAGTGAIKGAVDARNLREQRQTTGYTLGRRVSAGINTFAGLDPMTEFETELKQYDDFEKQAGNILNRASSEMIKYGDLSLSNGLTMAAHKREKERLTALENTDTSQMTSAELFRHTDELSRLRDRVNINDKKFANAYIDAVMTGKTLHKADGSSVNMGDVNDTGRDNQTVSMVQGLENTISTSSNKTINGISLRDTNGNFNGNIKGAKDSISDKKVEVTNSEGYQRALANKKAK